MLLVGLLPHRRHSKDKHSPSFRANLRSKCAIGGKVTRSASMSARDNRLRRKGEQAMNS